MSDIPYGYCHCGCGEKTNPALTSDKTRGRVKGEPLRYLPRHYARTRRKNPGPAYIVIDCGYKTPCWVWQHARLRNGYGRIWVDGGRALAHRHSYEQRFGPIPPLLQLDHLCRNPPCVNPDHLEPVTHAENLRRGINTKLNAADVAVIRASNASHGELAKRFGVTPSHVCMIRTGRSWREVS